MADRIGQQLGNYRLIRSIGQGGFADVYLGEHLYLQTQVALKLLQMRLAEEDIEEFLKEARTIAHLVHPHIVRVLDFGIEESTPFLVMDYASGGTLRRHHPKGTRLAPDTVVNYTKQIVEALQYAHEKKLIHRDIKPENMLLGENQQVLLSDFGIALIAQSTHYQNTQAVIGTAAYMAPEQLQGKPRQASDQYALGIVVYEWLNGERPFHGSFTEIYSQHLFVPPPSLREKIPELPPEVEEVVLTALAKDPKERFVSVKTFAEALEQACQGVSSTAPTLPSDFPPADQPLLLTHTVAAFPSHKVPEQSDAEKSTPPLKERSTAPAVAASSTANLLNDETTPLTPKPRKRTPLVNRHPDLPVNRRVLLFGGGGAPALPAPKRRNSKATNRLQGLYRKSRVLLLIGLTLLVLVESVALFTSIRTNQITIDKEYATIEAQTSAAAATATALAPYNDYVQATSGTPALDDSQIGCTFTDGAYHSSINQKNTFVVCYAQPTFSNFAFQAQMTILKGDYGGIVFRTNEKNSFGYRFGLGLGGGNLVYGEKELAKYPAVKAHLNQASLLTAIARGNSISLYIDKQWITTVEDSSASSGGIGFMAGEFDNEADIAFRHVQVWNL